LPIDALFGGVVEDVDFPEREQELAYDRIAHDRPIIALQFRSRYSITWRQITRQATQTHPTDRGDTLWRP
jgi:hypothetical protein